MSDEGIRITTATIVDLVLKSAIGIAVAVAGFFAKNISEDIESLKQSKGEVTTKLAVIERDSKYWVDRADRMEKKLDAILEVQKR